MALGVDGQQTAAGMGDVMGQWIETHPMCTALIGLPLMHLALYFAIVAIETIGAKLRPNGGV